MAGFKVIPIKITCCSFSLQCGEPYLEDFSCVMHVNVTVLQTIHSSSYSHTGLGLQTSHWLQFRIRLNTQLNYFDELWSLHGLKVIRILEMHSFCHVWMDVLLYARFWSVPAFRAPPLPFHPTSIPHHIQLLKYFTLQL